MSAIQRWLFPVAAALALATPVSTQWKPAPDAGQVRFSFVALATTPAPDLGLMSGSDSSSLEAAESTYTAPPLPGIERSGQDVAMMVVGGAALVVGSVIGGDAGTLMMVGGGVVGLVGLYQYVR